MTKDSFVVAINSNEFGIDSLMIERGATGFVSSNTFMGPRITVVGDAEIKSKTPRRSPNQFHERGFEAWSRGKTNYDTTDMSSRVLFGDLQGLYNSPQLYVDELPEVTDHYVVINVNAGGGAKVSSLRRVYQALLDKLVRTVLETHPKMRVKIPPPELGDLSVWKKVIDEQYPGRVSFFPGDKSSWQSIIAGADFMVSQDSGSVHMALLVQPEENVMTLAHDGFPQSVSSWRKSGQPFGFYSGDGPGSFLLSAQVTDWIVARLRSSMVRDCARRGLLTAVYEALATQGRSNAN